MIGGENTAPRKIRACAQRFHQTSFATMALIAKATASPNAIVLAAQTGSSVSTSKVSIILTGIQIPQNKMVRSKILLFAKV